MPASAITIRALGLFELTVDGSPVRRWQAGKARALLQLMLLHQGKILSGEELYESLWPEVPRRSGSSSLKVAAHILRRVLDAEGASAGSGAGSSSLCLVTREPGYVLEAENVWIDFEVFDRLLNQARVAQRNGHAAESLDLMRKSVELYQGHFLPDVSLGWADLQREWLRSRVLYAMECLMAADIASGDQLAVIDRAHRMLQIEPCREETYRALIAAHGRFGQISQVERWYRLCVARLRAELQIEPSPVTQRLYHLARQGGLLNLASNQAPVPAERT